MYLLDVTQFSEILRVVLFASGVVAGCFAGLGWITGWGKDGL